MQHFLDMLDLSTEELHELLAQAGELKSAHARRLPTPALLGSVLALVFEKPSLRTRVSFESGMAQLGGTSLFIGSAEIGLGARESLGDVARTISQYVDGVVLRTFQHETVVAFAAHATCPVINGLSHYYHPCQALADVFTIQEVFGQVAGRTLAFIGDGNNVARSLAIACGKLGIRFILAAPDGYQFDEPFQQIYRGAAPAGRLDKTSNPVQAVRDADVIYTDVWTSMGQESEREVRLRQFAGFQVNNQLLALAPKHARVMHCLPAHRGEEITSDVLDSDRSVVFQQAANRMHVQKALLKRMLK